MVTQNYNMPVSHEKVIVDILLVKQMQCRADDTLRGVLGCCPGNSPYVMQLKVHSAKLYFQYTACRFH